MAKGGPEKGRRTGPTSAAVAASPSERARRVAALLLVLAQFVCPLIFFTDLTRNPYLTQIALLNILLGSAFAIWAFGGAWNGSWRLPRSAMLLPWSAWLGICALSWWLSLLGHRAFFHPAMESEGKRLYEFLVANAWLPFFLALVIPVERDQERPDGAVSWLVFTVVWGLGWYVFSLLRAPAASLALWDHVWDPVGAFLWGGGCIAVLILARRGRVLDYWHLILCVGALASAYAVMQYFDMDWVWPKALDPYGGRSVSTFGNPNFMSSYMVMLVPVAVVLYYKAEAALDRGFYAACFWLYAAALLCSLTRSSWAGAFAALGVLALSPDLRRALRERQGATAALFAPVVLLVVFWPHSTVAGYTPSAWNRLLEIANAFRKTTGMSQQVYGGVSPGGQPVYAPLHQRLLIWACSWQMGLESPLTGKGWGLLELFYPFFQGPLLLAVDRFQVLRTHANNAHNEILEVFSQTGVIGLGVFLWLWVSFYASFFKTRRFSGTSWRWACVAGVTGMLVDNLLNVSVHFAVPAFLFWWQAGLVVGPDAGEPGGWRDWKPPAWASWSLCAAALCGALWLGQEWGGQWLRETDYFLGFKLIRQDQVSESVRILEQAHRYNAREVNTNYELGNAYARAGDYQKAVWAYDEALKSNCGYDEIYYNKASLLAGRLGDVRGALQNYLVSLEINPLNKDTYIGLLNLYLKEPARYAKPALFILAQALRVFPDDVNFLDNAGYFYVQLGDYADALPLFRKALGLQPDFAVSQANYLHAIGRLGLKDDPTAKGLEEWPELNARIARKDFGPATLELARRIAAVFPGSSKAHLYLGNLLYMNQRFDEAVPELQAAVARDPNDLPAHKNLAVLLEREGRKAEAAQEYQQVLRLDPRDGDAAAGLRRLGP